MVQCEPLSGEYFEPAQIFTKSTVKPPYRKYVDTHRRLGWRAVTEATY